MLIVKGLYVRVKEISDIIQSHSNLNPQGN